MRHSVVRAILWKELLDLSRDYKTLAYVILLPLLALPGLAVFAGGLYSTQSVVVYIVDEDGSGVSRAFVEGLAEFLGRGVGGVSVEVRMAGSLEGVPVTSVAIVVPQGFGSSLESIDGRAEVRVLVLPGSPAADRVVSAVNSYVFRFERALVEHRIGVLAERAGLAVDAPGFLDPLSVRREFWIVGGPGGGGAVAEEVALSARVVAFSLFFVVNPAIVFVSDSIVGERERKTLEKLLLTRATRLEVLTGKILATTVLGVAAAAADSIALVSFFALSGYGLALSPLLVLVWALSAILLVLLTAGISAVISVRSETIRSAQSGSFLVLMVALAIYFSSLAVDFTALPRSVLIALQVIPFTHASLAVFSAVYGDLGDVALHLAVLALSAALFLLVAARSFSGERVVMFR
ncbi:MAG: ABC transporter permease subunit [Aeropyrum sp.]|nr:ABC transporter permease subunit [Aeropyrum sp.]MCE4616328.1 ABC transporter permease subunit [Aeropyrum sp.]